MAFFNTDWQHIADKCGINTWSRDKNDGSFHHLLESITKVPYNVLWGKDSLSRVSVAAKMSWAADRKTTRQEDMAYCLIGIFGINMTMLYGEGERAFSRLQEEIIRTSDDESVFAWGFGRDTTLSRTRTRLVAASPADFKGCENVRLGSSFSRRRSTHYSLTNKGLLIERPLLILPRPFNSVLVPLTCCPSKDSDQVLALPLALPAREGLSDEDTCLSVSAASLPVMVHPNFLKQHCSTKTRLYIRTTAYLRDQRPLPQITAVTQFFAFVKRLPRTF